MTCIHDVPLDETCRDCMLGDEAAEAGTPVETLRDRFAMAALTGLLADPGPTQWNLGTCAACAYELADLMLAARGKR